VYKSHSSVTLLLLCCAPAINYNLMPQRHHSRADLLDGRFETTVGGRYASRSHHRYAHINLSRLSQKGIVACHRSLIAEQAQPVTELRASP
jgi:hypothetical protein